MNTPQKVILKSQEPHKRASPGKALKGEPVMRFHFCQQFSSATYRLSLSTPSITHSWYTQAQKSKILGRTKPFPFNYLDGFRVNAFRKPWGASRAHCSPHWTASRYRTSSWWPPLPRSAHPVPKMEREEDSVQQIARKQPSKYLIQSTVPLVCTVLQYILNR